MISRSAPRRHDRSGMPGKRMAVMIGLVVAVFAVTVQFVPNARAAGPAYPGPQTELTTGPAYFGPAPNPYPYCENPTYFDPFPENVSPIGRLDDNDAGSLAPTGATHASVTSDGITMDFEIINEGTPDSQYPGFFPTTADGTPSDQPKGVEMATGDAAVVTLSEPLFYSQWVFTDVDRPGEGFTVTPNWSGDAGGLVAFGGDSDFEFSGTSAAAAMFNETLNNPPNEPSGAIEGRAQVDFIGAVTGITMARAENTSGQSGFAVGGGCSPIGVSKRVDSGPEWNGTAYQVVYEIKVRNNLPSTTTLNADIASAIANAASASNPAGTIEGIPLTEVQLVDMLANPAFSNITIAGLESASGNVQVNDNYDGVNDTNLFASSQSIDAETEETIILTVQYEPDIAGDLGSSCSSGLSLTNSAVVSGTASGVTVSDESDNGPDPDPGVDNDEGGVDDPTPVTFPCPPASLQIVKTVVAGPNGTCPVLADAVVGDGDALAVTSGDTVTYCLIVSNAGVAAAESVTISDQMAPASFDPNIGTVPGLQSVSTQYDVVVDENTATLNTAIAAGVGPNGDLGPVQDTALIAVSPPPVPGIALSKTVVVAGTDCAIAVEGTDEFVVGMPNDAITWCLTVTNSGETPLADVIISDPLISSDDIDVFAVDGGGMTLLGVNESITIGIDGNVPADGLTNTATASATPTDDNGVALPGADPVTDQNTAAIGSTSIEIDKGVVAGADGDCADAVDEVIAEVATMVTYCFMVTNTGSVDIRVIDIVDETLGVRVPIPADNQIIPAGDAVVVSINAEAMDLVNTAEVSGTPVDANGDPIPNAPTPSATDNATVEILANPAVDVSKTAVSGGTCEDATEATDDFAVGFVGDPILWCFQVTNTGDVPVANVLLDDEALGLTNYDILAEQDAGPALLPNQTVLFGIAGTVPAEGLVNTGTIEAVASDPEGNPLPGRDPVQADDTAEVGSTGVELSKVVVAGPDGDCADAADEITVPVGTPVTFCFSITNTGSVDLRVTEIDDTVLDTVIPVPVADQTLISGSTIVVKHDAPAAGMTNVASVVGTPLLSGDPIPNAPQPDDEDTAVIKTQIPMLDLVKTVVAGPNGTCPTTAADGVPGQGDPLDVLINDTVTYCINVSNTGEVDINNVLVTDSMAPANFDGDLGTVEAGGERVLSFDLVVYSTTAMTNVAGVTGDDPAGGRLPVDEDSAIIELGVLMPSMLLEKRVVVAGDSCDDAVEGEAEQVKGQIGDPIVWCFTVTNDGNTPISSITLDDDLIGLDSVDVLTDYGQGATVLLVGESISFSVAGEVAEDDVVNTAVVTGTPSNPDGSPIEGQPDVSDSDDSTVSVKDADIRVVKTVNNPGPHLRGTSVVYTVTVSNDGPDEAVEVSVSDTLPDGVRLDSVPDADGWACVRTDDGWKCDLDDALEAGESDTLVYRATITDDAPVSVSLTNRVTVTSATPDSDPDDNEDITSVTARLPTPAGVTTVPPSPAPVIVDEVLPTPPVTPSLAYTGSNSLLLTALGALMVFSGGALAIVGRQRRRDGK